MPLTIDPAGASVRFQSRSRLPVLPMFSVCVVVPPGAALADSEVGLSDRIGAPTSSVTCAEAEYTVVELGVQWMFCELLMSALLNEYSLAVELLSYTPTVADAPLSWPNVEPGVTAA